MLLPLLRPFHQRQSPPHRRCFRGWRKCLTGKRNYWKYPVWICSEINKTLSCYAHLLRCLFCIRTWFAQPCLHQSKLKQSVLMHTLEFPIVHPDVMFVIAVPNSIFIFICCIERWSKSCFYIHEPWAGFFCHYLYCSFGQRFRKS